jgi:hypothetical protein
MCSIYLTRSPFHPDIIEIHDLSGKLLDWFFRKG